MTTLATAAASSASLWFALNQNWPPAILAGITALTVFISHDLTQGTNQ